MRNIVILRASAVLALWLAGGALAATGGSASGKTARDGAAAGIDWFDGTVDEAFAAADRSSRPVFLYWGAEWCPPCHAINNTVFKSPSFIERSRQFIPVYLDGDTANAQAAGEKFGVRGYPTMIVFSHSGDELTRIPGGIDVQAYANILDLTLANTSPVTALVDELMAGDKALSETECTQLAYYSWGQDLNILAEHDTTEAFRKMVEACPANQQPAHSILYFNWLDARLDDIDDANSELEDDVEPARLSAAEQKEATRQLNQVLGDEQLVRDNVFSVIFGGARYTAALTGSGSPQRAQLTRRFGNAYDDLFADERVYKRERLYTLAGKIEFERIDDPEADLSAELEQEIRDAVEWADESTPDPYERQPIINAAGNILDDAGMDEEARELLLKEIDISAQAYYFMPSLADIEQRAGNDDAALGWLKKAYDTAKGPATRFQWGLYYLGGLIEMTPDDRERISDLAVALVEEVQAGSGFYNRPRVQLQRLGNQLLDWSEAQDAAAALDGIRTAVAALCVKEDAGDSREACESFLDAA